MTAQLLGTVNVNSRLGLNKSIFTSMERCKDLPKPEACVPYGPSEVGFGDISMKIYPKIRVKY